MKTLLKIESSGCDMFNDIHHYQFHNSIAQFITSTIGLEKLNIRAELEKEYRTYIANEIRLYREILHAANDRANFEAFGASQADTLYATRLHTDECFHRICELIYATYLLATIFDEREELECIIYKLNQIMIQTKMLHYQETVEVKV